MLLVDSGSAPNACPEDYAPEINIRCGEKMWVRTATGEQLESLGKKAVSYELRDGSNCTVDYHVLPVTKTVLSVTAMNDRGMTCLMGPQGGFLQRPGRDGSTRTLTLVRWRDVYFLPAKQKVPPEEDRHLYPITQGSSSSSTSAPTRRRRWPVTQWPSGRSCCRASR